MATHQLPAPSFSSLPTRLYARTPPLPPCLYTGCFRFFGWRGKGRRSRIVRGSFDADLRPVLRRSFGSQGINISESWDLWKKGSRKGRIEKGNFSKEDDFFLTNERWISDEFEILKFLIKFLSQRLRLDYTGRFSRASREEKFLSKGIKSSESRSPCFKNRGAELETRWKL